VGLELDAHAPQEGGWAALTLQVGGHVEGEHVFARTEGGEIADAAICIGCRLRELTPRLRQADRNASRRDATLDVQDVRREGRAAAHAGTAPG
jgi:hypothetical protein